MKKFNLIKTRDGHRNGTVQSYFFGESIEDKNMIEVEEVDIQFPYYCSDGYNNSLNQEEEDDLFDGFDGSFGYDVWNFHLEEEIEEGEEV